MARGSFDVVFHKATIKIRIVAAEDMQLKVGEEVTMDVAMFNRGNEPDVWYIRRSDDDNSKANR